MGPIRGRLLLLSAFSGAAALIYQTVALRWFQLLFGSTAYAASATLSAFFGGLALGAALAAGMAGRSRRPLAVYAALEAAVALAALCVPLAILAYGPIYGRFYASLAGDRVVFTAVKFGLALVALLPVSTLLGAALPLLATAYVRSREGLGREGGTLYAVNTLGAAAGAAAGALWLPEAIGVRATYGVGIALSLATASLALLAHRGTPPSPAQPAEAAAPPERRAPRALLTLAFASGFGTLALEVLLLHSFAQILSSSVYSAGAILVVVLLCIAGGAALVAATESRVPARPALAAVLTLQALLLFALPALLVLATGGLHRYAFGSLRNGFLLAAGLGGPALLVGSLVLPLTFRLAAGGDVGRRFGGLLAANTLGGILGSLAASFLLLDRLGLWASIFAIGAGYGAAALLPRGGLRTRLARGAVVLLVAAGVLASPASPRRLPVAAVEDGERLLAMEEGAHGIVAVLEDSEGDRRIKVDNHYSLGGSRAAIAQERAAHLPLLLHPQPRRVAFVGSATGGTAAGAVAHPVESITLIELIPEVQALAAEWFGPLTRNVHRDPRTHLVAEDGRNHLKSAPERYDVVVADLFVPWLPGAGALFSREHFEAVKEHLAPGGVFCQWLPIFQLDSDDFGTVAATFLEVFPDATLWRGDFFGRRPTAALVAWNGPPPDVATLERRARELGALGIADRWVTDPRGLWMLYVGPLRALAPELAGALRNSDDHPVFEYGAGRGRAEDRVAFTREGWPALAERVTAAAGVTDPLLPGRPLEGPNAGAAFTRASIMASTNRPELAAYLDSLRSRLPPELLYPPDPNVADTWPR